MTPHTVDYKGEPIRAHDSVDQDVFEDRLHYKGWPPLRAARTPYTPPQRKEKPSEKAQ